MAEGHGHPLVYRKKGLHDPTHVITPSSGNLL
jgi:hypothetical protein